jgi:putative ABC transport system ATP-binding protein
MINRLYSGDLIVGENIVRSFGNGNQTLHVLRGLDITVTAGQMVALYGPSGSGKTTLLNILGALDRPNDGKVEILGNNILKMGEGGRSKLRRKNIGFIFQAYSLMPTYTATENIDLGLRLPGFHVFERRRRTQTALEAVGLSAWASHLPHELSGGQRQRVAIARALALRPAVILADEPTSGLDTRTARRVLALFRGIAEAQGTAFLIVSHDQLIAEFVDVTYDLHEGELQLRLPESNTIENTSDSIPDSIPPEGDINNE